MTISMLSGGNVFMTSIQLKLVFASRMILMMVIVTMFSRIRT